MNLTIFNTARHSKGGSCSILLKPFFFICAAAVLFFVQGCKGDPQSSSKNQPTEDEVRKILVQGKSKAEVDRIFGPPIFQSGSGNGATMAVYRLLDDNRPGPWEHRFSGFQAYYDKNDQLAKWTPNYSTRTVNDGASVPPLAVNLDQKLQFYIVSDSKLTPGRFIDTPKLPKLGYIAEEPDLEIHHIESLQETSSTNSKGEKQLGIVIACSKEDADGLEKLTTKNVGQKLLIIVDGDPIAAPWITFPIKDGKFELTALSSNEIKKFIAHK